MRMRGQDKGPNRSQEEEFDLPAAFGLSESGRPTVVCDAVALELKSSDDVRMIRELQPGFVGVRLDYTDGSWFVISK